MTQYIKCTGCGHTKSVDNGNYKPEDIFRGTIHCACGAVTFFELNENTMTFISGKYPFGSPHLGVPKDASDRLEEAKVCYFSGALRASAVMARSALEQGLSAKGFNKGVLEKRIEEAHDKKLIGDTEMALAHGTRLIGNNSIHEAQDIAPIEVEGVLGATIQILNKIFPK